MRKAREMQGEAMHGLFLGTDIKYKAYCLSDNVSKVEAFTVHM